MTDEQFTKQFISLSNTFYELSRYQEDYDKLIDLENKLNSSYIEEVVLPVPVLGLPLPHLLLLPLEATSYT